MPRDIVLTIPTPCEDCGNDTTKRGHCTSCAGLGLLDKDYEIRGNLPITMMVKLLEIERRIRASVDGSDVIEACGDANGLVNELIRERSPGAPHFEFSLDELLGPGDATGILGFVVSNRAVSQEVTETLVAGLPVFEPGSPEALAREAEIDRATVGGGDDVPLPLATLLSEPSSPSGISTPGIPSGGQTAPGERSAATA